MIRLSFLSRWRTSGIAVSLALAGLPLIGCPGVTGDGPYCCTLISRSLDCGHQYPSASAEGQALLDLGLLGDEAACESAYEDLLLDEDYNCADRSLVENHTVCDIAPGSGRADYESSMSLPAPEIPDGFPQLDEVESAKAEFSSPIGDFTYFAYGYGAIDRRPYDNEFTIFVLDDGLVGNFSDSFSITTNALSNGTYNGSANGDPANMLWAISDTYYGSDQSFFCADSYTNITIAGSNERAYWGSFEARLCEASGTTRDIDGTFSSLRPDERSLYDR